mgnify:CR=1 FL=1
MKNTILDKTKLVNSVFSKVYRKYDLMNDIMSFGIHRVWKEKFIDWMNPALDSSLIDVASGTGDIAKLFSLRNKNSSMVTCIEPNEGMFQKGKKNLVNFKNIKAYLQYNKIKMVDGILADLGVSSHQFDTGHRGFSTRIDGPLDMRMNLDQPLDAKTIVNEYSEDELERIFKEYGEVDRAKKFATDIINARQRTTIETTFQLRGLLVKKIPKRFENKVLAQQPRITQI